MAETILKSILQELTENEKEFHRMKWRNLPTRS